MRDGCRGTCGAGSDNSRWFVLCRCRFVLGRGRMFGGRFDWLRVQFFITAALALPGREHLIRSTGVLIDGADGWNDLAAAARTGAAARGASIDVDPKLYCQVFQS